MKRILILLSIVFGSFQMSASHMTGGEITWECIQSGANKGKFIFYMSLFRDCGGAGAPTTASIQSTSPAGSISVSMLPGYPKDLSNDCSANCASASYSDRILQEVKFKSAPIQLSGTPPAGGWVFSYTLCCRPPTDNLASATGQSFTLRAIMYPFSPAGPGTPALNTFPCFDNSPVFAEPPRVRTNIGYTYTYNNLGFDPELDSLYFDWADPLNNNVSSPVNWATGYSSTNPLPGTVTFNKTAGQITISNVTTAGSYVACLKIEAWRECQKIAEVFRDVPFGFMNATGYSNNPPDMSVSNIAGFPVFTPSPDSLVWDANVTAGEFLKLRISAQDFDLNPGFIPQQIELLAAGGNLGSPLTSTTNCKGAAPCATLTPIAPQTGFTSPLLNQVEFNWQTDCAHLGYVSSVCSSPKSTYLFYIRMQDNACPTPTVSMRTLRVTINGTSPEPPSLSQSCVSITPAGDITFDWLPPLDTGYNFDGYIVYKATSPLGPFTIIDTLTNYTDSSYTDVGGAPGPNWYFVRQWGGCNFMGPHSDTVAGMKLNLTPVPPTNSSEAHLSWNPMILSNKNPITYEIWRRVLGGTWARIDTTLDTNFIDFVDICGDNLEYQIRVNGSCVSTIESGFFADQNNLDTLVVDSISVTGGQIIASWGVTTQGDVTDYVIANFVQGVGWTPVDTLPIGTPMPVVVPGLDPTAASYPIKILSMDSCGNISSELVTTGHNNIFLRYQVDGCEGKINLNWNEYVGWPSGVKEYRIIVDETDDQGNLTQDILMGVVTDTTTFTPPAIINGYKYCFRVVAVDNTGKLFSTSNEICVDAVVTKKSTLSYIAKADVKAFGGVDVVAYLDKDADVKNYTLERSTEKQGPFTPIITFPKPLGPPWEFRFTDYSVNTDASVYYYRLRSINICDLPDTISNPATSMFLEVRPNGDVSNTLTWTPYLAYNGSMTYSIYRRQGDNGPWDQVATGLSGNDSVYVDPVGSLSSGKGKFCYYVQAEEAGNQWGFVDVDGAPYKSRSNVGCTVQEARIFVPNAFYPESDYEVNRTWGVGNTFAEEEGYELMVVNRWGQVVFESTNKTERWDGSYNGEPAPMGGYIYVLKYKSADGLIVEQKGTFNLMR